MIRPSKHAHPDKTLVYLSFRLLKRLRSLRVDQMDALLVFAKKTVDGGEALFVPSLDFLFLLGLVEYRPKTDSIEYVGACENL